MTPTQKHRWINTAIAEAAFQIPALPWERAAKRARRIDAAQHIPVRALA